MSEDDKPPRSEGREICPTEPRWIHHYLPDSKCYVSYVHFIEPGPGENWTIRLTVGQTHSLTVHGRRFSAWAKLTENFGASAGGGRQAVAPPRFGEALIGLFCKAEMREAVLGDVDEKFAELVERRGSRVARAWYWSQAARSVLFFAIRWGRRLLELEAILRRIL